MAIGGNLIEWLTDQRQCGASYQFMAGQLAQRGVMVSHETVRSWCQRVAISAPQSVHGHASSTAVDKSLTGPGTGLGGGS